MKPAVYVACAMVIEGKDVLNEMKICINKIWKKKTQINLDSTSFKKFLELKKKWLFQ